MAANRNTDEVVNANCSIFYVTFAQHIFQAALAR